MFELDLAYPFSLGLVAAFNPCGFAMLPVYVSFFLGNDSDQDTNTGQNLLRAIRVGGALTLGFITVFGSFGILTAGLLRQGNILDYTPYITFGLGLLLVPAGIAMLAGRQLKVPMPRFQKGGDTNETLSMFLFGVSYAIVSLSCTIGVFLAGVSSVFSSTGFVDGVAVFVVYGLGMGAVIMTLTIGLAMARTSIATNMRKILPWINRISAVLLTLSGAYLALYGWWEIQVLRGNLSTNRLINFFENARTELSIWIEATGPTRLGTALLFILAAALLRGAWSQLTEPQRRTLAAGLVAAWLIAEFAKYQGDLFVLPTIRTIAGLPTRIGNWFTDPFRWALVGELLVVAIIGWTLWTKATRSLQRHTADSELQQPVTNTDKPIAAQIEDENRPVPEHQGNVDPAAIQ